MPGSQLITFPASKVSVDSARAAGSSCTSSPIPWPRPWPNCSPQPAAAITSRAAASASRPLTPGPYASSPASSASRQTSYARAELVRQVAGRERARAVGRVAVDPAARVDRDERVRRDLDVADVRMRAGAVLGGGDDRVERELRGAVLVEELADPPRQLPLGAARELLLGERCRRPCPRSPRPRAWSAISSGSLIARSRSTSPDCGDGVDAALTQLLVRGDRDDVAFDPDRPARPAASRGRRSPRARSARSGRPRARGPSARSGSR